MSDKIRCSWAGDIPIYIEYHDNRLFDTIPDKMRFSQILSELFEKAR